MQYGLVRRVLSSQAFVPITGEEYTKIAAAKAGLLEVLFLEEKFDLLIENYLELETTLLDSTARIMVFRNQDYQWFQLERSLFNRRLVNLLSASRSYVDCSKHHVRVTLPEVKEAVSKIEQEFARHYDACLGYRVMEALRNFVQHRGFPVHAVEYPSGWLGGEDDLRLRFGLSLYTKTEYLGEDDMFKKSVLEELVMLGGRVDLKTLVRDYVAALGESLEFLREMVKHSVESWDATIIGAIDHFKSAHPNEGSIVGLAAVMKRDQRVEGSVAIFSDLITYRKSLQRKNGNLGKLGKRFVTGESISG